MEGLAAAIFPPTFKIVATRAKRGQVIHFVLFRDSICGCCVFRQELNNPPLDLMRGWG